MITRPIIVLCLGFAVAGCSRCGGDREQREQPAARTEREDAGPPPRPRSSEAERLRQPMPEAALGAVQGEVKVDRSGRQVFKRRPRADAGAQEEPRLADEPIVPASDDLELYIGDTVRTGADGSAELRLPEQAGVLALGPQTTVRISRFAVNEVLVLRGRLHARMQTPPQGRRVLRVGTPACVATLQGGDGIVAVADDGATRVYALDGTTKVRTPSELTELEGGKLVEIGREGAARLEAIAPDGAAQADQWLAGRNERVARQAETVAAQLVKTIGADAGTINAAFEELRERRAKNREILKRSSAARAKRSPEVGNLQQELSDNSRALVEATDRSRAGAYRVLLRWELLGEMRQRGLSLGAAEERMRALESRVGEVQAQTEREFRRFPKRARRPGPAPGIPRMPPLPRSQTQIPRDVMEKGNP